jgi:branched-chain amino acid transport system permease protein
LALDSLLQVLLSGAQIGCIYGLLGLSYYVILSATGILNFAQGEWMMISGVLGAVLLELGLPYPVALVGAVALATFIAMLAERLVIRPLQRRHASLTITILSLFGVMIVARYGTALFFGRTEEALPGPVGSGIIRLTANSFLFDQSLVIYGMTAVIFAGVFYFTRRTWLGRSLRVAAIDPLGASLVGVDLARVRFAAFGIGGLIAAIVAWLYGPLFAVGYLTGAIPGVKGFIAVFVGGMGSPLGALVGGLLLGIVEVAASRYLPSIYSEGIAFLVLMLVLFLRPRGIIPAKEDT